MDQRITQMSKIFMSTSNSAFRPIKSSRCLMAELEMHVQQLYNQKKTVTLQNYKQENAKLGTLTKIIKDMIFSVYNDLLKKEGRLDGKFGEIEGVSFELFKMLCLLISHNLFQFNCKYYREVCTSMVFEKSFVQIFKKCFFDNSLDKKILTFSELDQNFLKLSSQDYKHNFENNIYRLCSGSFLLIERVNFSQTLKYLIRNMGKVFTQRNTLITRHFKSAKKSKQIVQIVNNSIKLICNHNNEEFIRQQISKATEEIFGDFQSINKEQFLSNLMNKADKAVKNSSLVWIYFDLLRVECIISQDTTLQQKLEKEAIESYETAEKTNFYTQEMQKLLNKCPYNGDESCNCKKCQCVRRNRESAKLSQQKKRNAVEQLNPMKLRVKQLELRNRSLQEENQILRGIVNQMRDHPGIRQILTAALQPMNKVINDDDEQF